MGGEGVEEWGHYMRTSCYCVILAVITAKPISISENIVCPAGKHTSETQRIPRTKPSHGTTVKLSIHNGPDQPSPPQQSSAVGPVVVPVADFDFDMHTEAA